MNDAEYLRQIEKKNIEEIENIIDDIIKSIPEIEIDNKPYLNLTRTVGAKWNITNNNIFAYQFKICYTCQRKVNKTTNTIHTSDGTWFIFGLYTENGEQTFKEIGRINDFCGTKSTTKILSSIVNAYINTLYAFNKNTANHA